MKELFINKLKSEYLYVPQEVLTKIDKYFDFEDTEILADLSLEEIKDNLEECFPEIEFLLKEYSKPL